MNHVTETQQLLDNSVLYYIIITGMDGNYSYVNKHYQSEFAHIETTLVGEPYYITMHPDDRKTCEEVAAQCFKNPGNLYPATIRKHDGKGGYVYTQWEYKAIFDSNGNPDGVFCLGYNISKYVADGLQLLDAKQEIEKYSESMKRISFQQSHLLRAPLSNIMGLSGIIDKSLLDSNTSNIIDMILESATQLDNVIRSIVSDAGTI